MEVIIVGAGLAGCEAALQLANKGIKVKLYEKKKTKKNEIQKSDFFAELVCSNTFRSMSTQNAVGILKKELELFNSFILDCAYKTAIPSDDALAVDREAFSLLVEKLIRENENIDIIEEEFKEFDEKIITLVTCGPLITPEFQNKINELIGNQKLFYLDASSPIIEKNSIDFSKVYYKSRHGDDKSYICIPLDEKDFEAFHSKLVDADVVKLKDFEKEIYFTGCQPIEQLAKVSKKSLLNGPMSPNNLENNKGVKPYAVVQLRKDDAMDNLYNMVGFQTNITWSEQQRIFSSLPGLENASFKRFGVMHKNNYINSPKILNKKLQVMRRKNIFFAGQITGVEGYIESFSSAIVASLGIISTIKKTKFLEIPSETILGSLINYITNPKIKKLKPMKANLGIIKQDFGIFPTKEEKNNFIYNRSIKVLKQYLKQVEWSLKV